jgi:hypothetical protein
MSNIFHAGDRALWFGHLVDIKYLLPSRNIAYIHCTEHLKCKCYADLDELLPIPKTASKNQIKAIKTLTEKPKY